MSKLQESGNFSQAARDPGELSGHGTSILICLSGRRGQPLMPSQISHVATIALMISSQTNQKHTDRPQQNGREVTSLVWLLHADIISCNGSITEELQTFPYGSRARVVEAANKAPVENRAENRKTALSSCCASQQARGCRRGLGRESVWREM